MATRYNLVPNPSFEVDTAGWEAIDAGATIAQTTAQHYVDSGSLAVTMGSTSVSGAQTSSGTAGIPVTAGLSYTAQGRILTPVAHTSTLYGRVYLKWYDSSGALLSQSLGALQSIIINSWNFRSIVATAPTGAAYASVAVNMFSGDGSSMSGKVLYVDAVMLAQSSGVSEYFDGDTTDTATVNYYWSGTAHNSTSVAMDIMAGTALGQYTFRSPESDFATFEGGTIPGTWTQSGGTFTVESVSDSAAGTTKAMRFPDIGDLQEAYIEFACDDLSAIRYKVSSEEGYDFFRVSVDGSEIFTASGTPGVFQRSDFPTQGGTHTIRLRFTKDTLTSSGDDTVWISVVRSSQPAATGSAPPIPPKAGTAAGSFDLSGTASGSAAYGATTSGAGFDFTGSAAGYAPNRGAASGAFDFTGLVAGDVPPNAGTLTGSFDFTGSATGSVAHNGSTVGAYDETGSSVGATPTWQPHNLVATAVSGSQIDLTWDALGYATAYDIERDGVIVATDVATNSYSDTGLTGSTLYTYRVRAVA